MRSSGDWGRVAAVSSGEVGGMRRAEVKKGRRRSERGRDVFMIAV